MKVELLTHTPDPLRLAYSQTRGTTTSKGFAAVYKDPRRFFPKVTRDQFRHTMTPLAAQLTERTEMTRLVQDAIAAGHLSVTRGVTFTFAITCARSTGRQLLRHVVGVSWEEMSQRYVKLASPKTVEAMRMALEAAALNESGSYQRLLDVFGEFFEIPPHLSGDALAFDWFRVRYAEVRQYLAEIQSGVPAEDARENLPNCTLTQMVSTWSFEALRTFLAKRLCTRAQYPIRQLAKTMRKQALAVVPWAGSALTVQCLPSCICPESSPGSCPLLADQGGRVLRKEQALDAVRTRVGELRLARESAHDDQARDLHQP